MNSLRHSPKLALAFAVLIAASWLLLWAPGAQAAPKQRGAVLVKDISSSELTDVAGTLYFAAQTRKHGSELWRSDGTRRGTRLVKDIRPGKASSHPQNLTAVGGTLFFTAKERRHGRELWRSDGTAGGTRMVRDITPGPGSTLMGSLTDVAGTLYFVDGDVYAALWRSDGTEAGTTMLKELAVLSRPDLTAVGGTLYFAASDGPHGQELWRSDGTAPGTWMVKDIAVRVFPPGNPWSSPYWLTDVRGTLFFAATDSIHGRALWRSDGTEAGTTLVKEVANPRDLTDVAGTLYFDAEMSLWRSDGTEAETTPITYLGPRKPEHSTEGLFPQLTNAGGTLYFVRNDQYGGLFRTDGTPSGTTELHRNLRPGGLTAVGHTLYLVGTDKRHGQELWRSNGTRKSTKLVRDIHRGKASSRPQNLTAVGGTLFFTAKDGRHGRELWRAGPRPCKTAKGKCKKR